MYFLSNMWLLDILSEPIAFEQNKAIILDHLLHRCGDSDMGTCHSSHRVSGRHY